MRKLNYILLLILLFVGNTSNAQYVIHIAGNDSCNFSGYGNNGDGGPAIQASVYAPVGICRDANGNLYFTDQYRVRMVSAATGIIKTIAGGGPSAATGDNIPATSAYINKPEGIYVDAANNLYIADVVSRVRKVDLTSGTITTLAGTTVGYSGDGGPASAAQLNRPIDVSADSSNNIYIADAYNNVIRKVSAITGIISTIAGNGTAGFNGDSLLATQAELNVPWGVYID